MEMKIFAPISKSGINYSVDDKNDKDAMLDATVTIAMSWEWMWSALNENESYEREWTKVSSGWRCRNKGNYDN